MKKKTGPTKRTTVNYQILFMLPIFVLLLPGCMRFYRTTDVRNNMNDGERKLTETISTIETFKNDYQTGYNYLTKDLGDKTTKPFPRMIESIQKLETGIETLKGFQPVIAGLKKEFEALVAGFPPGQNIQSDKPGWEEFKPIKARYMALVDAAGDCVDDLNDAMEDLRDLSNDHGIGKTNSAELKNQITSLLAEIDRSKTAAGGSSVVLQQKQNEMKALFEEITAEIGDRSEIWMMPGSFVTVRFESIKKLVGEVNALFSSLNK